MSEEFLDYARQNWIAFGIDDRGYYVTRDASWVVRTMREEGWNVARTGETQMMPDDTIRTYIAESAR